MGLCPGRLGLPPGTLHLWGPFFESELTVLDFLSTNCFRFKLLINAKYEHGKQKTKKYFFDFEVTSGGAQGLTPSSVPGVDG